MLAALAAALMLTGTPQAAEPANAVDPAVVEARKRWPGVVPTDLEIANQLRDLLKEDPGKVICLRMLRTGSRLPHEACRTLRGWYDFEAERDKDSQTDDVLAILGTLPRGDSGVGSRVGQPPYELVDMIKARYRSPAVRAMAAQRAKARLHSAPRSPADPPVSNP